MFRTVYFDNSKVLCNLNSLSYILSLKMVFWGLPTRDCRISFLNDELVLNYLINYFMYFILLNDYLMKITSSENNSCWK